MERKQIEMSNTQLVQDVIGQLSFFFGQIVLQAGGSVALAYLIFRAFGAKWLESRFDKNLENHKSLLNRDLEQHRYEINSLFNRITKIHEKEIDVLPTAWAKLQDTISSVVRLTHPFQEYTRLDSMNESELIIFLGNSGLNAIAQERILTASDKDAEHINAVKWHKLNEAYRKLTDFHQYLQYNRIFMSADLFALFKKVDDVLKRSLDASEFGMQYEQHKNIIEAYEKLTEVVVPIADEIEKAIQKRLHHSEAL